MALNANQKAFLDIYRENMLLPIRVVAEMAGVKPNTVYDWKYKNINGFADEMQAMLDRKWDEAKYLASEMMEQLAREGDFRAAKYMLDHHGYAAPQKVEVESHNTVVIKVED